MTEQKDPQALFDRSYQLEQELITLKEDIGELKGEFSYHKDYCPNGLDKDDVKKIMKAAKAKAAQDNLKDKIAELTEIEEIQNKYS